jgi:hypothetical protein
MFRQVNECRSLKYGYDVTQHIYSTTWMDADLLPFDGELASRQHPMFPQKANYQK